MIFTKEQIDEIEQKLAKRGAKDTQLPLAKIPLTGDESIAIVQERENRLVPVGSIVNTDEGIFNVSEYLKVKTEADTSVNLTLSEAVEACPSRAKKAGQIVTFLDKTKVWQQYQYQSDSIADWNDLLKWKNLNDINSKPIDDESTVIYNISDYIPGGSKYGQQIGSGIYTIYGTTTPVSQYRVIGGYDSSLGEVSFPLELDETIVIKEIEESVSVYDTYYLFVGNSIDGYSYQNTLYSDEDVIPAYIPAAFGDDGAYVLVNINRLENKINGKLDNKVDKVQGKGLSTNDFTNENVSELANSIVNATYNSNTKKLVFTKNNNGTVEIDATPFIKDGMVNSVSIDNGYLVITFNTDSGKETIRIALTDIFNPDNYYTKTQTNSLLGDKVDKEQGKGLSTNDYTTEEKTKLGALPTNAELTEEFAGKQDTINDLATIRSGASAGATAVQPSDLGPIEERLDDVEEALTESLPVESFVMDDYSIGSETITGTNISSHGTVPIKECEVPYVSGNTITIDGVTYSKAIRKDYTYPYIDGVLAKFDFEKKGNLMVYYGFGGRGSYETYRLQFLYTSEDGTIVDKLIANKEVFDTENYKGKVSMQIPKKGILTIKSWSIDEDEHNRDNGNATNIVRLDFTATPLIDVEDLKNSLATVATSGSYNDLSDKPDLSGFITNSVDNLVNYYLKSETYTKTEVQQLIGAIQQFHYEVYPTLPQTGASNVLYLIGPTGSGSDKYEEYVYANNDWTKIGDTSIDLSGYVTTEALTTALADYVTSSALSVILANTVAESGVYDVTANNNNAKFASLSALLSSENLDTLIPSSKRKGGMSIKFVLSSDNKYIQARCMAQNFTTDITQWQGVDDEPTANSNNLVKSGGVYSTTPSITNTDAESDLDFSDEDGNVLMSLYDGHVKTKYFDSSDLPSGNIVDTSSKAIYTVANTLTNGQTMTLNNPNLKNHYTLSFSATVNTMGTITIAFGSENAWSKGRVEITPTNIVYYQYSTWEPITIQHNIDIQENISVIIKTTKVHFAEIYLLSNNSNMFYQEISWNGSGNGCSLSNANGSYSNCTFSLNCQGLLKDVWIFGDSYTNSWPVRLDELGFDNYLLDGFSGRNSQQACESFIKDIAIAKPKAIIWMMGMNDSDNGSVNSSWKTAFDNVKTLCDTYKIEFIYTTIPCVPQHDNSYKNNYAINSGVRIIPMASILGASSQGSSWYAGLLSSDNVHPSNSGSLWIALTLLNNITLLQEK